MANKKLFLNEIVFRFPKNIESPRTVEVCYIYFKREVLIKEWGFVADVEARPVVMCFKIPRV